MTWFALYDTATGELRSHGSVLAETLPTGLAVIELTDRPTLGWNPETRAFDVPPPPPVREVTAVEFMQLFTVQERIAIRSSGDPVIDDFLDLVRVAGTIRMDSPVVQQGLGYLAQNGFLTTERAAEIGGA